MKYHPDRNKSPLAHTMMVSINAAYEILSDNEKRKQYHNLCSDESKANYHNNAYSKDYSEDNGYANIPSNQDEDYSSKWVYDHVFNSTKRTYKVSIWWQMLFAIIPIVNCWAFYRIERSIKAMAVMTPLFFGLIVFVGIIPDLPFPLLRMNDDRMFLYILLFGLALVFFIRKWSIQWNDQVDKFGYGIGSAIDEKVSIYWNMLCSVIPFVNLTAFARIEKLGKSVIISLIIYPIMTIVSWLFVKTPSLLYFTTYILLTSPVLLFFMYRWTTRWNSGRTWDDSW